MVVVAVPVAVSDVAEVDFVYTYRSCDISGVSMISVEEEDKEVVVVVVAAAAAAAAAAAVTLKTGAVVVAVAAVVLAKVLSFIHAQC